MGQEWKPRRIDACADFYSGGTPSKSRADYWDGDIPWVSSGEMSCIRLHDTDLHVSEAGIRNGSRLVPENTVLAVVRGMSLAKEFRVSITRRDMAFNQDVKALMCKHAVEPEFLFYALFARRNQIRQLATEASHGTKKLETDVLAAFEIAVPDTLQEQRDVIKLISVYDDLMECNSRRIELIEESASQLFREWFVRHRFPGREHLQILNGVPEGWAAEYVGLLLCHHIGGGWGQDEPLGSEVEAAHVIRGTDIADINAGRFEEVPLRFHDPRTIGQRLLKPGDIVFEVSGGSATQAIGRTLLVTEDLLKGFANPFICASFCKLLRSADRNIACFLFRFLRHIRSSGELSVFQKQSASALQNFQFQAFLEKQKIVVPGPSLLRLFGELQYDMLRQQHILAIENDRLRVVRDVVLSRVMSGGLALYKDPAK